MAINTLLLCKKVFKFIKVPYVYRLGEKMPSIEGITYL